MKISREKMAENRIRILEISSALFRERGFEAVTIDDVMKAAGLTRGGFYGHFSSKEDLIAKALTHTLGSRMPYSAPIDTDSIKAHVAKYLSLEHRDDPGAGCHFASLGIETPRQTADTQAVMTAALENRLDWLINIAPGPETDDRRRASIATFAAMVGALVLSRMTSNAELSEEIIEATRAWIEADDRLT